jgi:hypothetical protein
MTKDDALRMMLGPFKAWRDVPGNEDVVEELTKIINAVEKVLAQPEQEPVAWATKEDFCRELERRLKHIREEMKIKSVTMRCKDYDIALPIIDTDFGRVLVGQVSTPPQRKPLTDKAITQVINSMPKKMKGFMVDWDLYEFARAIEAKPKENT